MHSEKNWCKKMRKPYWTCRRWTIFPARGFGVCSASSNWRKRKGKVLSLRAKVRILDEHTHSADNYIEIEAAYLSEETANRWLAKGGRF